MYSVDEIQEIFKEIESEICLDFGLDERDVRDVVVRTLDNIHKRRERERKAALKRCGFEVINGGKNEGH